MFSSTTGNKPSAEVVVYTSEEAEFSEPIFNDFIRNTQINLLPKYDIESAKTGGLVSENIAEVQVPRRDVFWNNEFLNTVRLEKLRLLEVYRSTAANGNWHGFPARARLTKDHRTRCQWMTTADKRP